jgi:predicted RNase H-like HicB family nuclease
VSPAEVTRIMARPYRVRIEGDAVEGFAAQIVEFLGCITTGESVTDATEMLTDAMEGWIAAGLELGLDIPEPFTAARIA